MEGRELTYRLNRDGTHRRARLLVRAGFGFEGAGAGGRVFGELFHFFEALEGGS